MKKFLLKVALFLVLFVVTFALPIVIETAVRSRVSLELPKDKTILFVGDSHFQKGVNEKFIPGAFNWAESGDNYLNLFVRTRKLLEANPQVRTVFVVATPFILSENADWRVFNGTAGILLERNIIFYEPGDLKDCAEIIASALKNPKAQRMALLESIRTKTFGTIEEFGCFLDTGESSDEFWKEVENECKLGKERIFSRRTYEYSNELSVKYLRKLVDFVRSQGAKIIFLNPPVYNEEEFFDVPYSENLLKEKFPDVEFWDYGNFPMPENCFYNINHLNGKGAEIFSKELARRIEEEGIIGDSSQQTAQPEVTVSVAEP